MSYAEFCGIISSAMSRAGISDAIFSKHDIEGKYLAKADGLLFFGRPSSRKIYVKRPHHDWLVWNV